MNKYVLHYLHSAGPVPRSHQLGCPQVLPGDEIMKRFSRVSGDDNKRIYATTVYVSFLQNNPGI